VLDASTEHDLDEAFASVGKLGVRGLVVACRAILRQPARQDRGTRCTLHGTCDLPVSRICRVGYDGGGIGKGATGTLFVDGKPVAEGRIPQTVGVRFSLDETFDVGSDTGTPVAEDYVDKMPFTFTGTLKKFVVILEPENLTAEERKRLLEQEAKAWMSVH
jgi:hypothetical protein